MFDFTKEVVINKKNWELVVDGARGNKFRVHGGGDYFAQYVVAGRGYKTKAQDGKLAVLKINADTLVGAMKSEAKHFTLNIELSLDRDARQDWATAIYMFKKPMVVDAYAANWSDNAAELGKLLKAVLTDYKFVHVFTADDNIPEELGVDAPAAGEVLVVGSDYNVKINKVGVYEYVCDVRCEGASEEPATIFAGRPADGAEFGFEYEANVVEFGTYNYLLHNLRMPTYENYRFTSPATVEMPMAGAKYTQFTFLYCVPRPGLGGMSVAGQYNHSTTTHVFFVESSIADDFAAAFEGVTWVPVESENHPDGATHSIEILPDSFATSKSVTSGSAGSVEEEEEA